MNEFVISIFFLLIVFIGAAVFSAKTKKPSFLSFVLNLEIEYIIIGVLIYLINAHYFKTSIQSTTMTFISVALCFMGMLIGTQFKYKVLLKVPGAFWKYIFATYVFSFLSIFIIFYLLNYDAPYLYAIILNTGMPYSLTLFGRLFRVGHSRLFNSMLVLSIYPAIALIHYSVYFFIQSSDSPEQFLSLFWLVIFTVGVISYESQQTRKIINTISMIFLFILAGLSVYFDVSPISMGFISGVIAANSPFGDIFSNIYQSFERFFYLFIYMVLGFFLMSQPYFGIKPLITAVSIYFALLFIRHFAFSNLFTRLHGKNKEIQSIMSIGVLPGFLLFDNFFTGLSLIPMEIITVYLVLYLLTEITNYRILVNETKHL